MSRCENCGIPIPELREDATPDEMLCDMCLDEAYDETAEAHQ